MKDIHLGIILDGNRRWAKNKGWKPWRGHNAAFKKAELLYDWITELGIKQTSLYCFSIQNFQRSEIEKENLFHIFRQNIDNLISNKKIYENQVKIRFVGRIHLFPEDMQRKMKELMEKTKHHNNFIVNFAMAYGGREEIVDTINKMVKNNQEITEETLQQNMWVPENLDIIIRTSGEKRLSNFFLWQAAYAELFFLKKHWPDFTRQDLINCLKEFKKRKRRFGK